MTTKKAKIKTAAKRNRTVPAREYRKAPKRNSPIQGSRRNGGHSQ